MKNDKFEQRLKKHSEILKESIPAPNCLDSEKYITAKKLGAAPKKRTRNRRKFYFSAAAVAAMLCICMFGTALMGNLNNSTDTSNDVGKNMFYVTAYAASNDGEITKKIDVSQKKESEPEGEYVLAIGEEGNDYSVTVYQHIGFKCNGKNIKSVTFKTDSGFFSQEIKDKSSQNLELKKTGNTYTIEADQVKDGSFVYWGMTEDISKNGKIVDDVSEISIDISATFNDGSIQNEKYLYDVNAGTLVLSEK